MELKYMQQLSELVVNGETNWKQYGEVSAQEADGLILFNYTPLAQFEGRWNWFERVSRGLILSRATGEVIARPFDKFHNWGENGLFPAPAATLVRAQEKMDGSLGIRYVWQGQEFIATRGSRFSPQAEWATNWWREHNRKRLAEFGFAKAVMPALATDFYTLLFEIIYPDNRVVVDYGSRAELVLLAARNRYNGEYLPFDVLTAWAEWAGITLAPVHSFDSVASIVAASKSLTGAEGWVGEFSDGTRWKFKGDEYRQLHKLVSGLNFQDAVEALREGGEEKVIEMARLLPEPYNNLFKLMAAEAVADTRELIHTVYRTMAGWDGLGLERKAFAERVAEEPARIRPYLFMAYDKKPLRPAILAREFKGRRDRLMGGADV